MKLLLSKAPPMKQSVRALSYVAMIWLFSACAVAPLVPLPATNPASPQAHEKASAVVVDPLVADPATQKTNRLLDAAEKGTLAPPASQPNDMSGMNMGGSHAGH